MSLVENELKEIDIRLLFSTLYRFRLQIVMGCMLGALLSFCVSYLVPVTYKSTIVVLPQEQDNEMNASGLLPGSLGNLANMAGVDIGGTSGSIKVNMEILRSRKLILSFIRMLEIEPQLMAADTWHRQSDTLYFDPDIYNQEKRAWLIEDQFFEGKLRPPTNQELYAEFMSKYNLSYDSDTGLLSVSFTHVSPHIAKVWLESLISHANLQIRESALKEAEAKINYLNEKIENTKVESIKSIFYQLIESEIQHKMLIDTKPDFAFKVIDPAYLPEEKFSPKRLYYLIFGGLITFFFIFSFVLLRLVLQMSRFEER